MQSFKEKIKVKFNASTTIPIKNTNSFNPHYLLNIDDEDPEFVKEFNKVISDDSIKDVDNMTPASCEPYLLRDNDHCPFRYINFHNW